jgi:hypothetical protein
MQRNSMTSMTFYKTALSWVSETRKKHVVTRVNDEWQLQIPLEVQA